LAVAADSEQTWTHNFLTVLERRKSLLLNTEILYSHKHANEQQGTMNKAHRRERDEKA
jgi:hypothetical protein